MPDWIARRCLVAGRVQGVFFRASTRARAEALGVAGHARNLPDGRVEVLACGSSTPAALRRATRVDVTELRAFLQAALFVQAVRWALPLDASAT